LKWKINYYKNRKLLKLELELEKYLKTLIYALTEC